MSSTVGQRGTENASSWKITIFYDGACPICSREINFLRRRNKRGTVRFENTAAAGFDPLHYGLPATHERIIHAMLPDRSLVTGLEVFRRVYREVGLGWLLAPTGWVIFRPIFDRLYLVFARNRLKISRLVGERCDQQCERGSKS